MGHKLHIYGQDYQLLRTVGSNGILDGQFMCPSGIAIDSYNRIFVSSMYKVDVFTMDGQFVTAVGTQGKGPLQFSSANGIAVSKTGKVYVADSQNNRIQILSSDLSYCTSFSEGCKTIGSGHLSQPHAIGINSEDNLYVADMLNHAVQVFTQDGKFLLKFGKMGPATSPGSLCTPAAIAIDKEDNVFVGSVGGSIGIFSKEGNFLRQFGTYGSELGQFSNIRGMHIDQKGHLYVSEWILNRIQIFPGSSSMINEIKSDNIIPKAEESLQTLGLSKPAYLIGPTSTIPIKTIKVKEPSGIAEGEKGEVIVSSQKKQKVLIFSPENDYKLVREIGKDGYDDGEFICVSSVAVTSDNTILVSSSNKLQRFTMDGKLVNVIGNSGEIGIPVDIALMNKNGSIYIIDSEKKCMQVFNHDASSHDSFKFSYIKDDNNDNDDDDEEEEDEDSYLPNALAINSEGNIYFTRSWKVYVYVCSSRGEPSFKFGKSGSAMERGVLVSPASIAIDSEDKVFIGCAFMISIFDKSGSFLRSFGQNGSDPGQFSCVNALHFGKNGYLYASDYLNNRVQIFACHQYSGEDTTPNKGASALKN